MEQARNPQRARAGQSDSVGQARCSDHYRAGFTPEAEGRYIVSGHDSDLADLATPLRREFDDHYPFPKRTMPKWLVWLMGPLANKAMTRKMISRNVGFPWKGDNSKGVRELGLTDRPLEKTVVDFFQQMVDSGAVQPRS